MSVSRAATVITAGVFGLVGVATAGVGVGMAATAGSSTITGCVAKHGGALRVVRSTSACGRTERGITWDREGPPGPAAPTSTTFQMTANVDDEGNLGSHVGAVSASRYAGFVIAYTVTFDQPIGSCTASAQAGFAGGDLSSGQYPSEVFPAGDDAFSVAFDDVSGKTTSTPFMLTVTCPTGAPGPT